MLPREEIDNLMKIEGEVRGAAFLTDANYIRNKKGEDALGIVMGRLRELGCPIDYDRIKAMEWLPLRLRAVSFQVIRDVFGWSDDDFKAMGIAAPLHSFIVKLLVKFFVAMPAAVGNSPKYWLKHYSVGTIEIASISEEERNICVRIHGFTVTRTYCRYLEGYFQSMVQMILPHDTAKSEEVKCAFDGHPFHEIIIRW